MPEGCKQSSLARFELIKLQNWCQCHASFLVGHCWISFCGYSSTWCVRKSFSVSFSRRGIPSVSMEQTVNWSVIQWIWTKTEILTKMNWKIAGRSPFSFGKCANSCANNCTMTYQQIIHKPKGSGWAHLKPTAIASQKSLCFVWLCNTSPTNPSGSNKGARQSGMSNNFPLPKSTNGQGTSGWIHTQESLIVNWEKPFFWGHWRQSPREIYQGRRSLGAVPFAHVRHV